MNLRTFALVPLLILVGIIAGKATAVAPFVLLTVLLCIAVALVTFHNPVNGLAIIVFSMLLSPEIRIADIPGRPLVIRIDDIMIIALFVAWLAHAAFNKAWRGLVKTPLDPYLLALSTLYVVSTAVWVIFGSLHPVKGLFYVLKYIEYFILYWITANAITERAEVWRLLKPALLTAAIVTVYAYTLMPTQDRVYAPFNIGGGEPASLGGYYLIVIALLCAFALHAERPAVIGLCCGLLLFIFPAFIRTLSRASYLALAPLLLTLFVLTARRRVIFGIVLLAGTALFPILSPDLYAKMAARVSATFTSGHTEQFSAYQIGSGDRRITDQSALERIASWNRILREKISRNTATLLIGTGVTGSGFIEGQFFLVLAETGVLGVITFYLLMFTIFRRAYRYYRCANDTLTQSVSLGLAAALAGLLVQSLTTNTFVIVRVMEPFWVLAAVVMILPELPLPAEDQPLSPEEPRLCACRR